MKKIVLVWNYPYVRVSLGKLVLKNKFKGYCELLNQYFLDNEMDWHISLDTTHGDIDQLIKEKHDMIMFLPGGETEYWSYKQELKKSQSAIYYLTEMEFYSKDLSRLIKSISGGDIKK